MISLKGKQFVPLQWVVPDYIPEGVTLLAGKPKIGKSWLVLGIALGVARGTEALDKPIKQREVLYCALEDNERRMQARTATIMGPCQDWPANMHVTYELRPIDAGGLEDLEWWVHTHPATGLIMIDTLAKVRGIKRRDEEPYQYDYRVIGMVQEFARQHRIAIVIVHHVRKSAAEDVLDTVSGTTGIAGAADTVIVLGQTEKGARLYLRGRDCEEQDKLVDLDPDTGIWEVLSDYDETDEEVIGARKQIVTLLRSTARPMTPKEIGARLGITPLNTRQHLSRMRRAGLIRRTDYGLYEPAATA
jgi:DNA-binding transcriptional ArsR family regulator